MPVRAEAVASTVDVLSLEEAQSNSALVQFVFDPVVAQ